MKLNKTFTSIKSGRNTSVTIDCMTFNGDNIIGDKIIMQDGEVIVDGVIQAGELVGDVKIVINGDVKNIETSSGNVEVRGNVSELIETQSGDVTIGGEVNGHIDTMSGVVSARAIHGSVRTMSGDIRQG